MARHHPDLIMCRKQPGIGKNQISDREWEGVTLILAALQTVCSGSSATQLPPLLPCSHRTSLREM